MTVTTPPLGKVPVLAVLAPRLDAATCRLLRRRVHDLRARTRVGLILDLERVEFVDSTGLTTLLYLGKSLSAPLRLRLVGAQRGPREVLRLTRLDRIFGIDANVEEALGSLASLLQPDTPTPVVPEPEARREEFGAP
ncbi:MAG: STAS domain-containing protein [Acidobacteriota bacterium]